MSADIGALFDERDSLEIAALVKAGEVTNRDRYVQALRANSQKRRSGASRR